MCEHDRLAELRLPPLCDECAVEILDFLYDLLTVFESHYGDQIRRYYDDRSRHNLIHPDKNRHANDPPFPTMHHAVNFTLTAFRFQSPLDHRRTRPAQHQIK